jgi:hypothetical protein
MLSSPGMFESASGAGSSPAFDRNAYVQATFPNALRVWWAYYWPTSVLTFLLDIVLLAALRIGANTVLPGLPVIMVRVGLFCVAFPIGFLVFYYVLGKRFRHFQVVLVPRAAASPSDRLPRSLSRTFRVWWAFTWRTVVYSVVVWLIVMFPLSWVIAILGLLGPDGGAIARLVLQTAIAGAIGMYIIYSKILEEEFGDFQVRLVPREPVSATVPPPVLDDRGA